MMLNILTIYDDNNTLWITWYVAVKYTVVHVVHITMHVVPKKNISLR